MLLGTQLTIFTNHRNLNFRTLNTARVLRWHCWSILEKVTRGTTKHVIYFEFVDLFIWRNTTDIVIRTYYLIFLITRKSHKYLRTTMAKRDIVSGQ